MLGAAGRSLQCGHGGDRAPAGRLRFREEQGLPTPRKPAPWKTRLKKQKNPLVRREGKKANKLGEKRDVVPAEKCEKVSERPPESTVARAGELGATRTEKASRAQRTDVHLKAGPRDQNGGDKGEKPAQLGGHTSSDHKGSPGTRQGSFTGPHAQTPRGVLGSKMKEKPKGERVSARWAPGFSLAARGNAWLGGSGRPLPQGWRAVCTTGWARPRAGEAARDPVLPTGGRFLLVLRSSCRAGRPHCQGLQAPLRLTATGKDPCHQPEEPGRKGQPGRYRGPSLVRPSAGDTAEPSQTPDHRNRDNKWALLKPLSLQ